MGGSALVFQRLHLPRPLEEQTVIPAIAWLAAARDFPIVAFEARGAAGRVEHLLGALPGQELRLGRSLAGLLPGLDLTALTGPRVDVEVAGSLRVHPTSLALSSADAVATSRAVLAALARARADGELLVLQLVVGPRLRPKNLPARIHDPNTNLWDLLNTGPQPAPAEVRTQTRDKVAQAGFSVIVRLGARAADPQRRHRLLIGLFAAVRTVQSPGVRVELAHARTRPLNEATSPWRWPIRLSVSEVPALLGWPLGEGDLPGTPPIHPRPLRASAQLKERERVFARSLAPGDDRLLGLDVRDGLHHLLLLGPTGVGKSTALTHLIRADLDAGRAVAVIDPKRDLVDDILAQVPRHRWGDVVVLDAADPASATFNPLAHPGADPDVVADGLLAVFQAVFADGWGPRTADILSASLRTLTRAAIPLGGVTLLDLPRLLTDAVFRRRAVAVIATDPGLAGFWAWYDDLGPAGQTAVIAAPMNKLRQILLRPALVRLLGDPRPSVSLRTVFAERAILLVPLNEALIGAGTATLLGSLVVAELWNATQARATLPPNKRAPAVITLDEAHRFLHLPLALSDALAVSRGLGVGWQLATQYRAQFPTELRTAVDANARSVVTFSLQPDDAAYYARTTPDLTAEDFQALGQHQVYLRLVTGGHPASWALAQTLPPAPPRHRADLARDASRGRHPATPETQAAERPSVTTEATDTQRPGRKRRTP